MKYRRLNLTSAINGGIRRSIAIASLVSPLFVLAACGESEEDSDADEGDSPSAVASPGQTPSKEGALLFIGHSQVNHQMPGYVSWLIESSGKDHFVQRQVIGGGNLEENFVLSGYGADTRSETVDPDSKYLYFPGRISDKGSDARTQLATGSYSYLIMTEEHGLTQAQARESSFIDKYGLDFPTTESGDADSDSWLLQNYQPTYGIASGLGFYHEAVTANADAEVFLYENWFPPVNGQTHCQRLEDNEPTKTLAEMNSWRKRILAYQPAWQGLAAEINDRIGTEVAGFSYGSLSLPATTIASGADVEVIPVAQALSVLVEDVCAEEVGSLTNPNELFSDYAHASQLGDAFIAMVMYAAVLNQTPVGLSYEGSGVGKALDDSNLDGVPADVLAAMAEIAWAVVSGSRQANSSEIDSCPGLLEVAEEQYCIDDSDDEVIPQYP